MYQAKEPSESITDDWSMDWITEESWLDSQQRKETFPFSKSPIFSLLPIKTSILGASGLFSQEESGWCMKLAASAFLTSVEVKNAWGCISTTTHTFWYGI